jgi:diguanylate cyclase (GGDEF)-like protein
VLLIDLDGFMYVNDSMGHAVGDELVTRVGAIMRESLRESDVIARLGGDEFAVIVNHADAAEGMVVAQKLLSAVQLRAIALSDNRYARVTASVGVTTFDANSGQTPGEVMVEADVAMYQAKERGKNTAVAFTQNPDRPTGVNGQPWLERLKDAIHARSFELFAQPIRGICANGVERFELLLRLQGAEGEFISPGTFLYIAERFDLIQQIDRWVFAEAAAILNSAHAAGNDISLSVNMSGKTLGDPAILDDLTRLLSATPVRPDRLVVEVTETAAIVNIDKAKHVARGLRKLGCRFALDDFGAGFASFYYLKHLEFDFLKIDGEFVRSLMTNPTDQLVIKSVVEIAQAMGAQTIAEFVGDEATLERLRELGVDYGQGFHLGAAGPLSEMLPVNPGAN